MARVVLFLALWLCVDATAATPAIKVEPIFGNRDFSVNTYSVNTYSAGIRVGLEKGWKVAWKNPGAAGEPFKVSWHTKQNVKQTQFHWPLPKRFFIGNLWSIGYEGEVVFPLDVIPQEPTLDTVLKGEVFFIACKEQCIPIKRAISFRFPHVGSIEPEPIEYYRQRVPKPSEAVSKEASGVSMLLEKAELTGSTLRVSASKNGEEFIAPQLFSEGEGWGNELPPPTLQKVGQKNGMATAVFVFTAPDSPPPKSINFILTDNTKEGERAITASLLVVHKNSLSWFLLLAFLGGLILNLMPCVLPVLSLKLAAVVNAKQSSTLKIRVNFIQSVAGILASFLLLWGTISLLKMAGMSVGWGFQFQSPPFLAIMAVVMFLFAASMFNLVTIGNLPFNIKASNPFTQGVFATALATPCSAPFVGSAVGFALGSGSLVSLAVFMTMAVGFAAPYLAVVLFPAAVSLLPKSGGWMLHLRRVLGGLLFATFIWLGYLAFIEGGMLVLAIGSLLPLGLILKRKTWFWASVMGLCLLIPSQYIAASSNERWRVFDEAELKTLQAQDETVFVDVTAKWCITCMVNKRILNSRQFIERVAAEDIILMQADWTLGDEDITNWMAKYNRSAVPLNIVFGKNAKGGIILPEILSSKNVAEAIDEAIED